MPPSSETVVPPAAPVVPPVAPVVVPPPAPAPVEEESYELEVDESSPLTEEELNSLARYAEKYGLSKEDAQAMVAAQESQYTRGRSEIETRHTQEVEQRRQQLITHPDFSGDKAAESWASVSLAARTFGTPELMAALNDPNKHGYDLSVALVLKNIGDQLRPESVPVGKGVAASTSQQQANDENAKLKRLYPGLFKE